MHPNIESNLAISTGNISKETAGWISHELSREEYEPGYTSPLTMYQKICKQPDDGNYGWWILVPIDLNDEDPEEYAKIPADLQAVLEFAQTHKCYWVAFDRDNDCVPELPTFTW